MSIEEILERYEAFMYRQWLRVTCAPDDQGQQGGQQGVPKIRGLTVGTGNSGRWGEPSWPNVRDRQIWHTTPPPRSAGPPART